MTARVTGVVGLVLMLVAGCGSAPGGTGSHAARSSPSAPATPAATSAAPPHKAPALVPLTATFSFISNGQQAPFYAALARRYYRAQGLDVRFIKAINPTTSIQWLAGHKVDITEDNVSNAVKLITKGAPLRVVATTIQQNAFGLIYRKSHPLLTPKDLYGTTVGVPAGTDADVYWKAFAAATHLDARRVKVANVSLPTEVGALGSGRVTAIDAASFVLEPAAEQKGMSVGFLPFGKFGVHGMANDIVATDAMLSAHPGWVRKFLYATAQGYAFAQAHPNQATADLLHYVPALNKQVAVRQLKLSLGLLHTANSLGKPWGWQAAKDWQEHVAMMQQFMGLKNALPVNRYYTNKYLPSGPVPTP